MRKIKLNIVGIHCKSCKELIEKEIELLKGIKEASVSMENHTAKVVFDETKIEKQEIINTIKSLNYEVEKVKDIGDIETPPKNTKNTVEIPRNILIGGGLLLLLGIIYYIVGKIGVMEIMGRLNESNLSLPLIFLIGILASFHCLGMCGGIVMAYTSKFCLPAGKAGTAVKGNKTISTAHVYYNLGRILSYTLVGAILGGIGSFFAINRTFTGIITLLAGLFMVAVGMSLLTRHAILDKITGILPISITRLFSNQLHSAKPKTPFFIGFLNGFIPCGPLQALQIYSLTAGSALKGGLAMAAFGLGTAPLMLGFGSIISIFSQSSLKQVMKISGIIVIFLGLLTVSRSFANFGESERSQNNIPQVESPNNLKESPTLDSKNQNEDFQVAKMDLTYQGYVPNTLTVKKGIPVKWVINAKEISGCTSEILLPAFKIDRNLKKGENIIEFTPQVTGTYKFSCGMQMVWGKFIVTE